MSKQQSALPLSEIEDIDRPVVYSGGSSQSAIYHLPKKGENGVVPLCGRRPRNLRATGYKAFIRRRNPSLCQICEETNGGKEYER